MKILKKAAIFALVLALFTVMAAGCAKNPADASDSDDSSDSSAPETYEELSEGDSAPDFTAETIGGGEFKLSDQSDKVVILNFWATWCPPCREELKLLSSGFMTNTAMSWQYWQSTTWRTRKR